MCLTLAVVEAAGGPPHEGEATPELALPRHRYVRPVAIHAL